MKADRWVVGLLALAVSSSSVAAAEKPPTWTELSSTSGLQAALGPCITEKEDKDANRTLLGTLALSGITKGVSMLGRALTNAGTEKTWSATASRNFEVNDGFPACLQVARGKFGNAVSGKWTIGSWPATTQDTLADNGILLSAAPDFLFEAKFVPSLVHKGGVALRPLLVSFGTPIGTRKLRSEKSREIAVFAAISPPGTKVALATNPGATLVLGEMGPYTYRKYSAPPEGGTSPYDSGWFSLKDEDLKKPLTLTVMVSETQGADAFLTFIGSVISDKPVQDALVKEASVLVLSEAREQAETTELTADAKAATAQALKFAGAQAKLAACVVSKAPAADGASAIEALNEYLVADRNAPNPHKRLTPKLVASIDIGKPETVTGSCQTVLAAITTQ